VLVGVTRSNRSTSNICSTCTSSASIISITSSTSTSATTIGWGHAGLIFGAFLCLQPHCACLAFSAGLWTSTSKTSTSSATLVPVLVPILVPVNSTITTRIDYVYSFVFMLCDCSLIVSTITCVYGNVICRCFAELSLLTVSHRHLGFGLSSTWSSSGRPNLVNCRGCNLVELAIVVGMSFSEDLSRVRFVRSGVARLVPMHTCPLHANAILISVISL
jgi:hypothetical protein